jgi:hypothetical protein
MRLLQINMSSVLTLINPIEEIQLSVELEQIRVNTSYDASLNFPLNFGTGLFFRRRLSGK